MLTKEELKSYQDAKLCYMCGKRFLRILTGKKHPKIKLQRLRKIRKWTFW